MATSVSCFPIHRPWLLGLSWKMPSLTRISTSKGSPVSSPPHPQKARRPAKVRAIPPALGWPPGRTPGDPGLVSHSSSSSLLVWADDTDTPVTKIELLPSYSTMALIEEPTVVEDPWNLPELQDTGIKWSGKRGQPGQAGGGCPSARD